MDVVVDIPEERLTKRYHRRWRITTGSYHAKLRFRDLVDGQGRLHDRENTGRRLLGTPLFLYRDCLKHLAGWWKAAVSNNPDVRFYHESRLWYLASFFWTRFKTDVLPRFTRRFIGGSGNGDAGVTRDAQNAAQIARSRS
jgi:hypothetical protein